METSMSLDGLDLEFRYYDLPPSSGNAPEWPTCAPRPTSYNNKEVAVNQTTRVQVDPGAFVFYYECLNVKTKTRNLPVSCHFPRPNPL